MFRMNLAKLTRLSVNRGAVIGCSLMLLAGTAMAASGPFADFPGAWSGTGKIQPQGKSTERIRCNAKYSSSGADEVALQLACESDTYKFDLSGNFSVASNSQLTGSWTERTRGVGGTATGVARGDNLLIHVESSAFSGNMTLVTHGTSQAVSIDTYGGGEKVHASITLRRGSR
jgi:hypothetical protein